MAQSVDSLISIGEFARRSRLSLKALRVYDRRGLLRPAKVDPRSGYRRYHESQLETARLIAMLRRLDMPLDRVVDVLRAADDERAGVIKSYWVDVETRLAFQRELAMHLQSRLSGSQRPLNGFVVRERDVPEAWVLTEQRNVLVGELVEWMGAASDRLRKATVEFGGPAGHDFVILHGEVNEDSDGPVEVCVPIDPAAANAGSLASHNCAIRREPAHRVAYVRLRKAQVQYPQILSAYDAVEHWISENARRPIGSPREIYLTAYCAAALDDEVCDVAFPIEA